VKTADQPESLVDTDMLRRTAEASRNLQKQARCGGRVRWFDWVPDYLEGLADRIDAERAR
jgi:hypothetical protein